MDPIIGIARAGAVGGSTALSSLQGSTPAGKSFGAAFESALSDLSKMQDHSQTMARDFQAESSTVTLEETMISMQQSSLAFQAAVQVRNKLVTAYNEVMNMQV